jgi:hypothetical protein
MAGSRQLTEHRLGLPSRRAHLKVIDEGEPTMQLGMIGLGRMGADLVRRAMRDGHDCVVHNPNAATVKALAGDGATGVDSLA